MKLQKVRYFFYHFSFTINRGLFAALLSVCANITLITLPAATYSQTYFEGELTYRNTFIDKESFERLFEDIRETVVIKGGKYRADFIQLHPGQVAWQIENFETGQGYDCKDITITKKIVPANAVSYIDSVAVVHSHDSVSASTSITDTLIASNTGTTKVDSNIVPLADTSSVVMDSATIEPPQLITLYDTIFTPRIYRNSLCMDSIRKPSRVIQKTFTGLRMLDTTMVVAGLNCHIMEDVKDGFRVAEYFFCDSIKIDPQQYGCRRTDGDDRIYKFSNGSLITRKVIYDIDAYIYVMEMQTIEEKKIPDESFEIPAEIELIPFHKE